MLNLVTEAAGLGETVHQRREPPRKALGLPHARKTTLRIGIQAGIAFVAVVLCQATRQIADIRRRQVQPLGPRGRNNVRGIAGQEQAPESHRLGHETAQWCDALFDRRPGDDSLRDRVGQAPAQFVPERVVAPLLDLVLQRALNVVTAAHTAALAAQREAALVMCVYEFITDRRSINQDAEPAKRINLLVGANGVWRHAGAAHAVIAIATGYEVATQLAVHPAMAVANDGAGAVKTVHARAVGLVNRRQARRGTRVHQVTRHFGLAIDRNAPAGEPQKVYAVQSVVEGNLDAIVHQAFPVQALGDAHAFEQVDRGLL